MAYLRQGAKEHPKIAELLEAASEKVQAGIFTSVSHTFTDESTGKQRQARIDPEDAEDILAEKRQREEHAKKVAFHQAELAKLSAAANSKGSKS